MTRIDTRILIVDDELEFRSMLRVNLEAEGYCVVEAADGTAGLALHRQAPVDLIVLDLMLPNMDGLQFLQTLRSAGDDIPVLMLTARSEERTKLKGFDSGADDYLTKPCSILELLSRVRAILRRVRKTFATAPPQWLVSGPFRLDRQHGEFFRGSERLEIGPQGVRILEILFTGQKRLHSRGDILRLAWESTDYPGLRAVDAHIFLIRKLLGDERRWLMTVEGMGYRWTHPVQPVDA
jgi:DNA-binding response OmpR family regulator